MKLPSARKLTLDSELIRGEQQLNNEGMDFPAKEIVHLFESRELEPDPPH
jgi:hypothetical protein